jgi:hypothetical protein
MADPTLKYQRWYTNDYNSINAMRCPAQMGSIHNVGKASDVIGKVKNNLQDYALAYPISGVISDKSPGYIDPKSDKKGPFYNGPDATLGSNYYVKMGTCSNDSDDVECRGQPRYVYVRNIPVGGAFKQLTGCNIKDVSNGRGLLPGVIDDISDMLSIGSAIGESDGSFGSYKCKRVTQPVGKNVGDAAMQCPIANDVPTPDELEKCLYKDHPYEGSKSWWMETRCAPQSKEYRYLPSIESFGTNPSASRPSVIRGLCKWSALLRIALVALLVFVLGYLLVISVRELWGCARAFKNGAPMRIARRSD